MNLRTYVTVMTACAAVISASAACGDDETGSGGSGNTATNGGNGGTPGTGGSPGTGGMGETPVHGCTLAAATDMTGMATVDLAWSNPHNQCILVDVGTVVNWNGTFTLHPLVGGVQPTSPDATSPITLSDQTTMTAAVTFDTAGDYPYYCTIHASMMNGVVYVQ